LRFRVRAGRRTEGGFSGDLVPRSSETLSPDTRAAVWSCVLLLAPSVSVIFETASADDLRTATGREREPWKPTHTLSIGVPLNRRFAAWIERSYHAVWPCLPMMNCGCIPACRLRSEFFERLRPIRIAHRHAELKSHRCRCRASPESKRDQAAACERRSHSSKPMRPRRASPVGTSERSSTRPPQYRASGSRTTSRGSPTAFR